MMAVVARPQGLRRLNPERRIGAETAGLRIEPELHDDIGAGVIARRLQDIVLDAGDVWHKGEAVRRIGRNRMGSWRGFMSVDWLDADRAVCLDPMYRH